MLHADDKLHQFALVLKSHGTKGEIVISMSPYVPEIELAEPVFIFYDRLPVPFFIESFSPRGKNKALIKLSGIETIEDAEEICGRKIYIGSDSEETGEQEDISGFTLRDQNGKDIGIITDIADFSGNICLLVRRKESEDEIYIPLHEDLILEIDPGNMLISLEISDGLI